MLIQDTERCMSTYLSAKRGTLTAKQRAKIFHMKMLQGDVREAVRYLTDRSKGGVRLPNNTDKKTGDSVVQVLESKHPDEKTPDHSLLKEYPTTPDFVDVNITEEVVKTVTQRLSGSAGVGGTDVHTISH